jgi:ActR/RegA family two-component response regulator
MLVVDDDPMVVRAIQRLLPSRQILHATTPKEGIEILRSGHRVRDVLLDVNFAGGVSGLDYIEGYIVAAPTARLHLMTGQYRRADSLDATIRGARIYIEKTRLMASLGQFVDAPTSEPTSAASTASSSARAEQAALALLRSWRRHRSLRRASSELDSRRA